MWYECYLEYVVILVQGSEVTRGRLGSVGHAGTMRAQRYPGRDEQLPITARHYYSASPFNFKTIAERMGDLTIFYMFMVISID